MWTYEENQQLTKIKEIIENLEIFLCIAAQGEESAYTLVGPLLEVRNRVRELFEIRRLAGTSTNERTSELFSLCLDSRSKIQERFRLSPQRGERISEARQQGRTELEQLKRNYERLTGNPNAFSAFPCWEPSCSNKANAYETYCNYHEQHYKNLVRWRTSIPGTIQEVIIFATWWSSNLATVVNGDYNYGVRVIVYEPAHENLNESIVPIQGDYANNTLEEAKNKARWYRNNLTNLNSECYNNPILAFPFFYNSRKITSEILKEPYLRRIDLPPVFVSTNITQIHHWGQGRWGPPQGADYYETSTTYSPNKNPEKFLKPLDVVWAKKNFVEIADYYHVGVYLGNNQVCDIPGTPTNKKGARIRSWEEFVENCINGEIFAFRSVVPFKSHEQIIQQITYSIDTLWREGEYCLAGQNCEHASNMLVYGIEYSKQVEERPSWAEFVPRGIYAANKNKANSVVIRDEIQRVNNQLGRSSSNNWQVQQIQKRIIVPQKGNCIIM